MRVASPSRTSEEPSELEEHGGAQEAQKADPGNTGQLLREMTGPREFAGESARRPCAVFFFCFFYDLLLGAR